MKKESNLQKQVVALLSLYARKNNFVFFSVPNESALFANSTSKRAMYPIINYLKSLGMLPGCADMVIVQHGKVYFLELKSPTGRQSENQKTFEYNVKRTGCCYECTDNYDIVVEILKKWGIL